MDLYNLSAIIITIAVIIGYLNYRFIKMQTTIATMFGALILSLVLFLLANLGFSHIETYAASMVSQIDFRKLLLNGMLSFLLFAGALTVDSSTLRSYKWEVFVLSTVSTIASAFLIGFLSYYLLHLIGIQLNFIYCMLFGALISPTDPIAVLATFKEIGAPKALDVTVSGESLFNDGVGIVIFLTIYQLSFGKHVSINFETVSLLFLRQAIGGILYGAIIGFVAHHFMKSAKDHKIQILITLAVVTGGYALALYLNISGPLAMVVAGIIIGNKVKHFKMTQASQHILKLFWELIDEVLNIILFLLIGFETIIINVKQHHFIAAALAIPLVLFARYVTVAIPMVCFKLKRSYCRFFTTILVWGGLRGGLAVALALSIPPGEARDIILTMTYAIVSFAIIVQGLTVKSLVKLVNE